ncbi:unnamed protein product [Cuscuta epithymum]|uniref:SAC9 second GBDL domain-containing protein n=1 Tax=Cuscuta epithymum TaxID=186058 RepID=A0AAV0D712_9ASTE|nr:unnamed protein product [Cuscuta epithymum]
MEQRMEAMERTHVMMERNHDMIVAMTRQLGAIIGKMDAMIEETRESRRSRSHHLHQSRTVSSGSQSSQKSRTVSSGSQESRTMAHSRKDLRGSRPPSQKDSQRSSKLEVPCSTSLAASQSATSSAVSQSQTAPLSSQASRSVSSSKFSSRSAYAQPSSSQTLFSHSQSQSRTVPLSSQGSGFLLQASSSTLCSHQSFQSREDYSCLQVLSQTISKSVKVYPQLMKNKELKTAEYVIKKPTGDKNEELITVAGGPEATAIAELLSHAQVSPISEAISLDVTRKRISEGSKLERNVESKPFAPSVQQVKMKQEILRAENIESSNNLEPRRVHELDLGVQIDMLHHPSSKGRLEGMKQIEDLKIKGVNSMKYIRMRLGIGLAGNDKKNGKEMPVVYIFVPDEGVVCDYQFHMVCSDKGMKATDNQKYDTSGVLAVDLLTTVHKASAGTAIPWQSNLIATAAFRKPWKDWMYVKKEGVQAGSVQKDASGRLWWKNEFDWTTKCWTSGMTGCKRLTDNPPQFAAGSAPFMLLFAPINSGLQDSYGKVSFNNSEVESAIVVDQLSDAHAVIIGSKKYCMSDTTTSRTGATEIQELELYQEVRLVKNWKMEQLVIGQIDKIPFHHEQSHLTGTDALKIGDLLRLLLEEVRRKTQVWKILVQKSVKYWEGRSARMKCKWKIKADSYHPP